MRAIRKTWVTLATIAALIALHSQAAPADERLERFCIGPGAVMSVTSSTECAASFAHAVQGADDTEQVVVTAPAVTTLKGAEPLHFQKRAPWVRRLEKIGKEGIAFVRVPRGPDRELVIGINRKGVLGFQVRPVADR
ncbi:MAG TPA: hypothetical protein VFS52_13410 [Steroidobacteraceae bacterium]|jgi:hypothetical protein|nr:hypothetical protein [Steroidobacteraceae bacterium]